ncbi:glycosyltransferase family 4 protein [Pantoea sp. BIGb0393]|uniref:Glycosyltransferase family 4 protein n=1 Tax=Pantoea nemavictus TaxID=2726955 RepID=A0ABU8PPP7_9GAMM|nr:glycosyltransferase family 4 protein [Pantoea nemavictus]MBA0035098.1 glycosyltransferase family 4 protein [Pantoea nemavictus]
MNLALIIDDYLPESTRVGAKMFHELALEFIKRGHHVTVITPKAEQHEDLVMDSLDGVAVWRFKNGPIKDVSYLTRGVNETLLSLRAWKAVRHLIKANTFDGIVYYSPSVFWGGLVKKIKQRCLCRSYLVLRDMFPQWAIDAGMIKSGSLIEKYFRHFEMKSYTNADSIGVMSENNLTLFNKINPNLRCEILRNWAEVAPFKTRSKDYVSIRQSLDLTDKVIFFYGGNIGHAQDMANLMRLTRSMEKYEQAYFLYLGQGDEVSLINDLAKEWSLKNFTYLPSVNQSVFKSILSEVDVGLFSLAANHTAFNFPGKLLGYMVESLPILGSINAGNDLESVVNDAQAGFIHLNGEDELLFQSAVKLLEDVELRKCKGIAAFNLLNEQFSVSSAADIIEHSLEMNNENL